MFIENNPVFVAISLVGTSKYLTIKPCLYYKIILLLNFLVRVFFSVDLSSPSEIATARNDLFPAHRLLICLFSLSEKAQC